MLMLGTVTQFILFLDARLEMHLGVTFLFVGTREFAAADITLERLLAGVCSNVCRQMIGARK